MLQHSLLSLLIWIPIFAGAVVLAINDPKQAHIAKWISLITVLVTLALCVPLYLYFNTSTYHMQFVEKLAWLPSYHIYYNLGVDGISMPLVILSVFTTLVVVLTGWNTIDKKVSQYMGGFLIMQGMMVGMFCAVDAILFYIFWEGTLIPMFICIGVWGSSNRSYAAIKFFLYTFLGSALMLIALLYLYFKSGSFDILSYYPLHLTLTAQIWIFFAFLMAFAVKVPMWPVHTWLPDAHTEAPAGGSVILAALMLKMGGYGFLRFSLPITPDATQHLTWFLIALSLIAIVYIGLVAIVQKDMKRLIAYSSIAHMGIVTLGCFMIFEIIKTTGSHLGAYMSLEGAMVQMISHAFSTGAMFIGIGILYHKMHTREIKDFGGIVNSMPIFASLFMLFAMANVGLPGTSGFVGEFMVILSAFQASFWVAFLASSTLVLAACYTLWMYKRVFFGKVANEKVAALTDVRGFDLTALVLLAAVVLFIGLYPEPLLKVFHASVGHLLQLSTTSKLG